MKDEFVYIPFAIFENLECPKQNKQLNILENNFFKQDLEFHRPF
jgi:hypothetical protein